MAIGPTDELLNKYRQDYHAPDLDEVLLNINKYGTDDRSAWFPQEREQQPPQAPSWDRTAFRDAWMGSGVQNVPDMQNWLKNTGWAQHVGLGGSKGDVMQLPSGENIDAVLAAGLGGNRGGPQWTGRGEHGGNFTPFARQPQQSPMQPSWNMPGQYTGGWGGYQGPNWKPGGMSYLMGGQGGQMGPSPQMRQQMQTQGHRQFQAQRQQRMQQPRGTVGYGGMRQGGMGPSWQQNRQPMQPMQQKMQY